MKTEKRRLSVAQAIQRPTREQLQSKAFQRLSMTIATSMMRFTRYEECAVRDHDRERPKDAGDHWQGWTAYWHGFSGIELQNACRAAAQFRKKWEWAIAEARKEEEARRYHVALGRWFDPQQERSDELSARSE